MEIDQTYHSECLLISDNTQQRGLVTIDQNQTHQSQSRHDHLQAIGLPNNRILRSEATLVGIEEDSPVEAIREQVREADFGMQTGTKEAVSRNSIPGQGAQSEPPTMVARMVMRHTNIEEILTS